MDFREKQIAPPKSWIKFEDLCHALFKAIWKDPLARKNGRSGQPQRGVDIFGSPISTGTIFHGVQCKGKDQAYGGKPTLAELEREIAKADQFSPALEHWVFATTAPADTALQQAAREFSVARHTAGRFAITVLGWEDIQSLLADHPAVLEEFYPEHAFDFPGLIKRLRQLPSGDEVQELLRHILALVDRARISSAVSLSTAHAVWQPVNFKGTRDIGPALLGRALGPADAAACPRLAEVDSLVSQLRRAYSARLVGEPGAGKSVCAYQVALALASSGWSVVRLSDPETDDLQLDAFDDATCTLFLIDDAHLMPAHVLKTAEEKAGPTKFLLSTHNAVQHDSTYRGSISIDAKRAVRTIAAALRADPIETLRVVRRADDRVGEHHTDEYLGDRIDHAEKTADRPWQFCFVLGGGWRRAKEAADSARVAGADVVLAAAAINQIASRDAQATRARLIECLEATNWSAGTVDDSLDWLLNQRLLLAPNDLRCPHQRFASVVLGQILQGQDAQGREVISQILQNTLGKDSYPLAGLRLLLSELRFAGDYGRWAGLVPPRICQQLIERCWRATEPQERTFALLILSEFDSYVPDWPRSVLEDRIPQLAGWISNPAEPSGYGLGYLLNAIRNKDERLAHAIVTASDPSAVAAAVSAITPEATYNLAEFLAGAGYSKADAWATSFKEKLDRTKLLKLAARWPKSESIFVFARLCRAMEWWNDDLALDLVEQFVPVAAAALAKDPLSGFHELYDIASTVLRVFDPLGSYVGRLRPDARRLSLANRMCAQLKPKALGAQLSASRKRDFQNAAFLLSFLKRAAPAKFKATVAALDWQRLEATIGDDWRNLPHETEILIAIPFLDKGARAPLAELIDRNLHRITHFPPRLVIVAPKAAFRHVELGRRVRLAQHGHFEWHLGAAAVSYFADGRPDLLEVMLGPSENEAGLALSHTHPSWYREAAEFIKITNQAAPRSLQRMLDAVKVTKAEVGWTACLAKRGPSRRAVSLLIEASLSRADDLGRMARGLRKRFPKASMLKRDRPTNRG